MADTKFSAFPSTTSTTSGDTVVGLHSGANEQFVLSPTPAASALSLWDANKNLSANNILSSGTTITSSGATTTLTVSSTYYQLVTGTMNQTVIMPNVNTLALYTSFRIDNASTGNVTVESSGTNTIQVMASGTTLFLTSIATTGTTAASWKDAYLSDSGVTPKQVQQSAFNYGLDTGTADNYIVNLSPAVTTLTDGLLISFTANNANVTTAPNLTVNGLTASIGSTNFGDLSPGDIGYGLPSFLIYSTGSGGWVLLNATYTNVTSGLLQGGSYITANDTGTANVYALTYNIGFGGNISSGAIISFMPAHSNTGASTISINGAFTTNVYLMSTDTLPSGSLSSTKQAILIYGYNQLGSLGWILLNPQSVINPIETDGTFPPALNIGGAVTGITYSAQVGYYTRIGNTVTVNIFLILNSIGVLTGALTITGLPVSGRNSSDNYQGLNVNLSGATVTGIPTVYITGGTSTLTLYQNTTGTATALTNSNIATGSQFIITGTYLV